ncbi:MAG: ATP-binding protein [Bacteroidales bacterium]|nr:ATP-binding protein [Bacteroidales bacterium]
MPDQKTYPRLILLLAASVFMVVGIISATLFREAGYSRKDVRNFEDVLHKKERLLKEEFRELEALFISENPTGILDRKSAEYQELAAREGIYIFYYEGGALTYWSDHTIAVSDRWRSRMDRPFISLRNASYVGVIHPVKKGRLLGMIEVKTHYPFQNKFLMNGFQRDFKLDPAVNIEFFEAEGSEAVFNEAGDYLFSLNFTGTAPESPGLKILAAGSLLVSLLLFFAGCCSVLKRISGRSRYLWLGLITLLIAASTVGVLKYAFPPLLTGGKLFQPDIYASRYFPSLGTLLVFTVSALLLAGLYYLYGNLEKIGSKAWKRGVATALFVASALLLLLIEQLIGTLVLDSSISFEAHRVTTFTWSTVVGLSIIIMWFLLLGLILDKAIVLLSGSLLRPLLYGSVTVSLTFAAASFFQGMQCSWIAWIALLLILGGQLYLRYRQGGRIPFSRFIFLLLFISVFITIRLQENNRIHVERKREVELVKLASEHDPVAEMLFSEMSMAIRNDSVFALYLNREYIDIDQVEQVVNRLRRNYFSGYWSKYDLQVTICRPDDRVYLEPPDDSYEHCYTFFNEWIEEFGIEIPGSDFYFLDNLNGRISYLASIPYFTSGSEQRVYIELNSKIFSEELGYPELLLDENYTSFTSSRFSIARYNGGELFSQSGDFPYRTSSSHYTSGDQEFEIISLKGYDHSIYNVDQRNTIIVGSPSITVIDYLIFFSYIFAFNFLLVALVYLLVSVRLRPSLNWSFKNRIQYSLVGVLFLTFVLICSGTIYFIFQQYRVKHNDNLRNTMRSVYIELMHKLEFEEDLKNWSSDSYYNLDELLRKFSNVFYTDINLYDQQGYLLATSRSEIFDRQLLSYRMNRLVYENLSRENASEYIHNEHIGDMKYISAYVPLMNSENKFLAYLNLPYFTQSGALARDVTNLVVAVINVYLILILLILLVSVFLADRITQPLRMIQNRIAQVSLNRKNEMIQYTRSDEIRGLVEEYNYMVQELERSAGLLAQSERESAWREMAKQIAHEIKNPLTPMKLNVQHLQRAIAEGKSNPEMIRRISATLIEQIDSLSAIAREFSDFAKMPQARHSRINLVPKLNSLQQLFESTDRAKIQIDPGEHRMVYVMADKEQLMRVFINLVKNGLQSIPEGREGLIRVALKKEEAHVVKITFTDNGKGIPEEIRDKLFQPNFTTKSGGMGMGLAISHNIIRSLGGRIWYDTVLHQGTTFHVELPESVEKR